MGNIVWLKNWSSHKRMKKRMKEPMAVYIIILVIAISYASLTNISRLSISGLATSTPQPPQPSTAAPAYTPPVIPPTSCGAPCEVNELEWAGEIGVNDITGQCLTIKKYYDEKHCCVDYDCPIGTKCPPEGVCK